MEEIITLIGTLGLIFFVMVVVSTTIDLPNHKYYRMTFKILEEETFRFKFSLGDYIQLESLEGDDIILFEDNSVKLINDEYIHNYFFMYFNPYGYYYYRKFKKLKEQKMPFFGQEVINQSIERRNLINSIENNLQSVINLQPKKSINDFKFLRG